MSPVNVANMTVLTCVVVVVVVVVVVDASVGRGGNATQTHT